MHTREYGYPSANEESSLQEEDNKRILSVMISPAFNLSDLKNVRSHPIL